MTHVVPLNDIIEHELSSTCECSPNLEVLDNGELLITHNAIDDRTLLEQLGAGIMGLEWGIFSA
jgi:hypothetical protein